MEFLVEQISYQNAVMLDCLIREYVRANMVAFELGTYTGKASLTLLPHIRKTKRLSLKSTTVIRQGIEYAGYLLDSRFRSGRKSSSV